MKKTLICLTASLFLLSGCGKKVIDFEKEVAKRKKEENIKELINESDKQKMKQFESKVPEKKNKTVIKKGDEFEFEQRQGKYKVKYLGSAWYQRNLIFYFTGQNIGKVREIVFLGKSFSLTDEDGDKFKSNYNCRTVRGKGGGLMAHPLNMDKTCIAYSVNPNLKGLKLVNNEYKILPDLLLSDEFKKVDEELQAAHRRTTGD